MTLKDKDLDTICALATPSGVGGISVIRVSGPVAVSVARALCSFLPEKPESHRCYYGLLKSIKIETDGDEIDEIIVSYFAKGKSFTGEDTIEISCHGSPNIVRWILSELSLAGARSADRGEFTYRAFMNGRIDLVQAESVLALIESQTNQASKQALRQLQGSVSKELYEIEDLMIWCLAHMEASIDFSTEDIEVVQDQQLLDKIQSIKGRIDKLVGSFGSGRLLTDGFKIVLVGSPNVGKSSLLNLLVGEEKAIVTEVAGTTRDLVEGSLIVNGIKVLITDTAGLRESNDLVEKIGIERSYKALDAADAVFYVYDSSAGLNHEDLKEISKISNPNLCVLGNKSDFGSLVVGARKDQALGMLNNVQFLHGTGEFNKERVFIISAFDKKTVEFLKERIADLIGKTDFEDQSVISQVRQFENLKSALDNMNRAFDLIQNTSSPEFMSLEMKDALLKIQETIGKRFDDQIMDRVFKEFCIGK